MEKFDKDKEIDIDEFLEDLKEFEVIMDILDRQQDMDLKSVQKIEHLSKAFKKKLDTKYKKFIKEDP